MTSLLLPPVSACEHCHVADDSPKQHLFDDGMHTWHLHHTPDAVKDFVIGGAHSVHALVTAKTYQAANHLSGDALRDAIARIEGPKDYGDAEMILSLAVANALADVLMPNGASGTLTLGAVTITLPAKCKFLSTVSTQSTAGTEWATSGGYTAGGVALNGLFTTAAAGGTKANTGAVTVTNAPAGTWADNEIQDSTGTPVRLLAKGAPSLALAVGAGDTCTIATGNLSGAFS